MSRQLTEVVTLVGPLRFIWDDEAEGVDAHGNTGVGAVIRSEFGRSLRVSGAVSVAAEAATGELSSVVRAVQAWSDGTDCDALDVVRVSQSGSEFRQRCWQSLRSVKAGDVVSYIALAAMAGNARASRAAGSAMATNTVAPFVPCHRVVRTGGGIGNYSARGGSDTKAAILGHEGLDID